MNRISVAMLLFVALVWSDELRAQDSLFVSGRGSVSYAAAIGGGNSIDVYARLGSVVCGLGYQNNLEWTWHSSPSTSARIYSLHLGYQLTSETGGLRLLAGIAAASVIKSNDLNYDTPQNYAVAFPVNAQALWLPSRSIGLSVGYGVLIQKPLSFTHLSFGVEVGFIR